MNSITINKLDQYTFFYYYRKSLPKWSTAYYIFQIVKFFGVYLLTHNIDYYFKTEIISITSFLHKIRVLPKDLSKFPIDYCAFCIFIYILILLLLILHSLLFYSFRKAERRSDCKMYDIPSSYIKISPTIKLLMKVYSYYFFIINFLSQYIIELLGYAVFNAYYSSSNNNLFEEKQYNIINQFASEMFMNKYLLCVLNSLFMIIIIVISYSFLLFANYRTLTKSFGMQMVESHKQIFLFTIIFHLQGAYSTTYFFAPSHGKSVRFILCCVSCGILLINLFFQFTIYNISSSNVKFLFGFLSNACLISSIIEIAFYASGINYINQKYEFYKFLFEVVNGFFLTYFIIQIKRQRALRKFFTFVFMEENKNNSLDCSIIEYLILIKGANEKSKQCLEYLSRYLTAHQLICKHSNCLCQTLFTKDSQSNLNDQDLLKAFIQIGEEQIVAAVMNSFNHRMTIMQEYLLLHVDFLLTIKKEYFLSLYLCQYYLIKKDQQIGYLYGYFIFELNKLIFSKFKGKQLDTSEQDSIISMNQKKMNNVLMKSNNFLVEQLKIEKLKRLLYLCVYDLEKLMYLKQMKNNKKKMAFTCEELMNPLYSLSLHRTVFLRQLRDYFIERSLASVELSYLLTYGFRYLFDKKISKDFEGQFSPITQFDLGNYEIEQLGKHYLILFLDPDDKFIIKYSSINLIEKLLYKQKEFIGKNFNDLLPKTITEYHFAYMKSFLSQTNTKLNKDTFLMTRNQNLIRINTNVRTLPTSSQLFSLIIKITTAKKDADPDQVSYHILLDEYFNFIATTKRFEKQFFFTTGMLEKLRMDFCHFFGLNQDNLMNKFKHQLIKEKKLLSKTFEKSFHSLLPSVKPETYGLFSIALINGRRNKHMVIQEQISKAKTINGISYIEKNIDELGLEKEWNERILDLYKRLKPTTHDNLTPTDSLGKYFNFDLELKSIGIVFYYVVLIKEHIAQYEYEKDTESFMTLSPKQNNKFFNSNNNQFRDGFFDPNSYKSSFRKKHNPPTQKSSNFVLTSTNNLLKTPCTVATGINNSLSIKPNASFNNSKFGLFSTHELKGSGALNKSKIVAANKKLSILSEGYQPSTFPYEKVMLIFRYMTFCLFGVVFGLILSNILTNYYSNKLAANLFNVNSNSFLLKSDIYFSALGIITCCLIKDGIQNGNMDLFQERIRQRADDILNHYNLLITNVNMMINQAQSNELYTLMYSEDTYFLLENNWQYTNRNSSFGEEIYYIYYTLATFDLFQPDKKCRVKQYFYNSVLSPFVPGSSLENKEEEATHEEQYLFYIFANVITKLNRKMDSLTTKTNEVLQAYNSSTRMTGLSINSAVFGFSFLLYCIIISTILCLQGKYQEDMLSLFSQRPKEDMLLLQLSNFKHLLEDFGIEECRQFEITSRAPLSIFGTQILLDQQKPLLSQFGFGHEEKKSRDNKKKNTLELTNEIEQIEYNYQQFKKLIHPKRMKVIIIINCIVFVIFSAFEIGYILLSDTLYANIIIQNNLAINFLSRIPKLGELELYAITSVIYNNMFYIKTEPADYNKYVLANHYNVQLNLEADTTFASLKNSQFAFIYYQLLITRENIQLFTYDKKLSSILPEARKMEILFNDKNDFCIYMSYYYTLTEKLSIFSNSATDIFGRISRYTKECREMGKGINLSGCIAAFDLMTKELCNIFIQYNQLDKDTRDPSDFLGNSDYVWIDENLQLPFKKMQNVYSNMIRVEIAGFYVESYLIEILLSILSLFLSCGVIVIILVIISTKIQSYCNVAIEIKEMIIKVLLNIMTDPQKGNESRIDLMKHI